MWPIRKMIQRTAAFSSTLAAGGSAATKEWGLSLINQFAAFMS